MIRKNLFTKTSVTLSRCSKKWPTEQKTVCYSYPHPLPPHNEKISRSWFSLVPRYSSLPTSPFFFTMGVYGQSQSPRGQPWTEPIKTHHLITSLPSRHRLIRARHFPGHVPGAGSGVMRICFDSSWLPTYFYSFYY